MLAMAASRFCSTLRSSELKALVVEELKLVVGVQESLRGVVT
jgi:hypothetical protein